MKYILHIGQSKTGTTSLQSFLAENREALAAQGFLYPDIYLSGHALHVLEHNNVAEQLAGDSFYPHLSAEEYFRQFERQAAQQGCETIILSAESFFGTPQIWRVADEATFYEAHRKKIEGLKSFVGNDVQIIAYLRPQAAWFESGLTQIIRTQKLLEHNLYESDEQLLTLLRPHLDYGRLLDLWRDAFGAAAKGIIPFARDSLTNGDIVDDFCARLAINIDGLKRPQVAENEGWDRRYIWLKEQLNRKTHGKAKERTIIALLNDLNAEIKHPEKYRIAAALRQKIEAEYAESNQLLCAAYHIAEPNALMMVSVKAAEQGADDSLTEAEKQDAQRRYKKALYSCRAARLYTRYAAGAFLRKHMPFVNAWLKRFVR